MLALSTFALRRLLNPWTAAGLALLLALGARGSKSALGPEVAPLVLAAARALSRENLWSILLVFTPLFWWQAARLGTARESAWLAPTPTPRLQRNGALLLGCTLACALVTLGTALVSEAATPGAGPAWRLSRVDANPSAVLFEGSPPVRWTMPAPEPGAHLSLWTTVAPGSGPAVSARFSVQADGMERAVEGRVAGRTALELAAPETRATLALALERVGEGALLVLPPRSLSVLAPVASERAIALVLGARVWLFLASGAALAFGLGRFLSPLLASASVLALALLTLTNARLGSWAPGADLPAAWSAIGQGLVPLAPPPASYAGAGLVVALALCLSSLPQRGGRA